MSKTFKANPTTDKHNLRKRIIEIESNPTTTSSVTKITSDDVGDGLEVSSDDKLNLNLGDGLEIDSGKVKVKLFPGQLEYISGLGLKISDSSLDGNNFNPSTWSDGLTADSYGKVSLNVGNGLEIDDDKVQLNFAGHLKYDTTYGTLVKSDVLTARNFHSGYTWGDTLERTTDFLIDVKNNSIKPDKLDIVNEPMFRAMCVNRTAWINFQAADTTASGIDIKFNTGFHSADAQYSVETFHYNDSTRMTWYRIHLRGRVKYAGFWADGHPMAVITKSDYRPPTQTSRKLALFDSDGPTDYYTNITVTISTDTGNIAINEIRDASSQLHTHSFVDLGGVVFETRS